MSYVLFISEAKLKDSTAINLNVDVDILLPFVREAQKIYVETPSETGNALTTEEAQSFREEILNTGSYYRERLISYLCNNNTLFPEYTTNTGSDISPSRENYYNNMNLERPQNQGTKLTLQNFLSSSDYS